MGLSHSPTADRQRLDDIVRSVNRLRPLPGSPVRILKELDNPTTSVRKIAELIALDQAITAYLLKVANSAAMGYSRECSSVQDAVIRLGFKQVRSLVYSTMASGPLSARLSGYRLGAQGLWFHSVSVASSAHWLATALRYPEPEKAYIAGLLHDIGKLVLDQYVLADYNKIMQIIHTENQPMWKVEHHLFGVDHAEVGGFAGEHWQFPQELIAAIRYHHSPEQDQPNQQLAALVNLANALAPSDSDEDLFLVGKVITPATYEILNLNPEKTPKLAERLKASLTNYQSRFEIT